MRAPDAPAAIDNIPKAPPGPRRRTVSGGGRNQGGKPARPGGPQEGDPGFEKLHARDKDGSFTAGADANTGPAPDEPSVGMTGPKVTGLQNLLNQLGYTDDNGDPLKADGNMGPVTVAALVRAQRNLNIKGEDGFLGPKTRAALRGELGSITETPKPKTGTSGGSRAKKPKKKPGTTTQAEADKTPTTRADHTVGVVNGKDTGDQADTYLDQGPGRGKYGQPWPGEWGKEPPGEHGQARRIRGYSDGSARYEDGTVWDPDTGKFRAIRADDGTVRPTRRRTVSGTRSNSTTRGNSSRHHAKPTDKESSAEEALQALYDLYGVKENPMSTALAHKAIGGLEHKALSGTGVKVISEAEGIIEAIVAVTGIVDEVKDLIVPGAFTKTLATRLPKGVHSHDWDTPTSKALSCVELMPGDPALPGTTARGEPWPREAGGVKVVAQYNLETDDGRKAYSNAKFFDDEQEWSIGYHVPRGKGRMDSKTGVRHIDEMELYEFSDVLFGAMPLAGSITGHKGLLQYEPEIKSIPGSFEDLRDRLDRATSELLLPKDHPQGEGLVAPGYGWVSVRGTFPDHVVVCHYGKGGDEQEWDIPYTIGSDGNVTLGTPKPVDVVEVVVPAEAPPTESYDAPSPDETKTLEDPEPVEVEEPVVDEPTDPAGDAVDEPTDAETKSAYVSPSEILANESLRLYT